RRALLQPTPRRCRARATGYPLPGAHKEMPMAGRNLQNLLVPAAIVVGGLSFILLGLYIPDRRADGGSDTAATQSPEEGAAPESARPDRDATGRDSAPASELTLAIRADDVRAVSAALAAGADVNERLPAGLAGIAGTPLMLAARDAR